MDLARDCERKRLKKAEMSKEELAASRQRASELSKQRKAALSNTGHRAPTALGQEAWAQGILHGSGSTVSYKQCAARQLYTAGTAGLRHPARQAICQFDVSKDGVISNDTAGGACAAQAQKAAQRVIAKEQGESLFSGADKHGSLGYSAKRNRYWPDAPLSADVVTTAIQFLQQQLSTQWEHMQRLQSTTVHATRPVQALVLTCWAVLLVDSMRRQSNHAEPEQHTNQYV